MYFRESGVLFLVVEFCLLLSESKQEYAPDWLSLDKRPLPGWYDTSKVGIFVHWGVFSVPSFYSEWLWWEWKGDFPKKDVINYMENNYPSDWTYADFGAQFRAELFDPNEWADLLSASGAKYVVFTSKHHEGFTMWPSKFSPYWNAMDLGPKRDIVGDLATAIRNRTDLIFGLYHSMYEWFHPLYKEDKKNLFLTNHFPSTKTLPELHEIVEMYKPAVIWSDGDWGAFDTYWNSTKFLAWLYNESPVKDIVVVNDRWGLGTMCIHGGFHTCTDRYNPGHLIKHKWENCFTIDKHSWGFRRTSNITDYMTIEEIVKEVVTTVSTGGNALINISPTAYGKIMPIYEERLRQLGSWLKVNGESIYGSIPWKYQKDKTNSDVWYTSSNDGKWIYAILLVWPKDLTTITLASPVSSPTTMVYLLGSSVASLPWHASTETHGIIIDIESVKPYSLQSDWAWVFKLGNVTHSPRKTINSSTDPVA